MEEMAVLRGVDVASAILGRWESRKWGANGRLLTWDDAIGNTL